MAQTVIRGTQILNNTVQRQDLDVSTVGQAVVTKLIQGSGITLSSTGADSGTGDVTVSSPDVVSTDAGNIATLGTDNHILVPQSQITLVRLRSINAAGNPTFEVDQRNVGNALSNPTGGVFTVDRWRVNRNGSTNVDCQQATVGTAAGAIVAIPGTNFGITRSILRLTNKAVVSVTAADYFAVSQIIEGPAFRELSADVHSVSILIRFSVANVKFGLSINDPTGSRSLVKLCQSGAANSFVIVTLPNLPIFPPAGTFSTAAGAAGYQLTICLDCGTTFTAAANDTWQNANVVGAVGQDHFCAQAIGTFCDIAFVQHEPGALCTTPIDCPFTQNYDDCLRYYTKSYQYAIKPGTSSQSSYSRFSAISAVSGTTYTLYGDTRFSKRMAKIPTCTVYNPNSGAANALDGWYATSGTIPNANAALTATGVVASESNILAVQMASGTSTAQIIGFCEWTSDTGW